MVVQGGCGGMSDAAMGAGVGNCCSKTSCHETGAHRGHPVLCYPFLSLLCWGYWSWSSNVMLRPSLVGHSLGAVRPRKDALGAGCSQSSSGTFLVLKEAAQIVQLSSGGCTLSLTALAAPAARLQGKQQVLHFPAHPALSWSEEALPAPLRAGRRDVFLFFMLFFLLIQFKKQKQMKAAWILAAQEKL